MNRRDFLRTSAMTVAALAACGGTVSLAATTPPLPADGGLVGRGVSDLLDILHGDIEPAMVSQMQLTENEYQLHIVHRIQPKLGYYHASLGLPLPQEQYDALIDQMVAWDDFRERYDGTELFHQRRAWNEAAWAGHDEMAKRRAAKAA